MCYVRDRHTFALTQRQIKMFTEGSTSRCLYHTQSKSLISYPNRINKLQLKSSSSAPLECTVKGTFIFLFYYTI